MIELKPCPCGGTAFLFEQPYDYGETYKAECLVCCINTPCSKTQEQAISIWNDHPMHKGFERVKELEAIIYRACSHLTTASLYYNGDEWYLRKIEEFVAEHSEVNQEAFIEKYTKGLS